MSKTIVITGSSTGIGKASAELFLDRGWNVVATMRTPQEWPANQRLLVTRLDVTDEASIRSALDTALARFGAIDAWVNNAGYGLVGTFESMDEAHIRRQFETNVFGLMRCTHAVLPQFRKQGDGVLVNVSSMGGRTTFPFYSVYHATKWAVDGFSEALQYELQPLGIRVKIIEPGAIRTDFYDRSADFVHDRKLTEYNAAVDHAMPRMNAVGARGASPRKVADAIWKAVTDESSTLRYVVGIDAKSVLAARQLMPTKAFQALIRSQLMP
jgi:NAD(P)-dependent dehydrogenase (short-subunit alcohol dehydrogenase family)